MNILVYQHERVEHPGIFREFLAEDGHSWTPVHWNEGETSPPFDGFDALWVMGGPMDVWEEDEHPWLVEEKKLIREAVEGKGLPFFGLCLGHQLLAEALGGTCGKAKVPEVGVMDVQMTEEGASGIFLDGLPEVFPALQWHGAEVTQMPAGAKCLATSPACAVQAMQWGPRAHSAQFHIEIEADTVDNWAVIPAYAQALQRALGEDGVNVMKTACDARMDDFRTMAERVYINWLQTAAQT